MRTKGWQLVVLTLVVALGATACGTSVAESPPAIVDEVTPARIALVVTESGLAGVPVGSSVPRWVMAGAVAAPDGSAVFATRPSRSTTGAVDVVRIDPLTGDASLVGSISGHDDVEVAAVEPGGDLVALVVPGVVSTEVIDFDATSGRVRSSQTFDGRVEPEAFSLSRTQLFAARIYADRYHVHVLDLATGGQFPTLGPDKSRAPEDMYGSVVQAALSPDGASLATLYRDALSAQHTGFVHLLSLETGLTVCIDLHAPFGTGPTGSDAITWREDGVIAVGHTPAAPAPSVTATFDPESLLADGPQEHYHADAAVDPAAPALPAGVVETPGFVRFVALAT